MRGLAYGSGSEAAGQEAPAILHAEQGGAIGQCFWLAAALRGGAGGHDLLDVLLGQDAKGDRGVVELLQRL